MKVLVTGSRDWTMEGPIRQELMKCPAGTVVVHGAARGADTKAHFVAKELGFEVRDYPVPDEEWTRVGPAAGILRNTRMLDEEHPDKDGVYIDKCFAFSADLENSRGTKNMVKQAGAAEPVIEITRRGSPWV